MKKRLKTILCLFIGVILWIASSCEEELVQHSSKEGIAIGVDDWEKHNV